MEDSTNRSDNLVDKGGGCSQPAVDLHDMQGVEDTSILEDLAEAEEDYDRPEQVVILHALSACSAQTQLSCIPPVAEPNSPPVATQSCVSKVTACCGQAFNEAGVAFEPFHLKKEREEGYFDPDGNYIQYKLDEVKDAWLDSLADGTLFACFGCLVHALM